MTSPYRAVAGLTLGLLRIRLVWTAAFSACGAIPDSLLMPAVPDGALGYPSRAADLDALPGFRDPPPGYGEVPFWWWTGDPLDRDRLLWQIEELHRKGIAGVQVNYAHEDTPGWPTYATEPEVFSDRWWDFWKFVAGECGRRNMGIGLSGYTLDWPNGRSLISRTIYSEPEIGGRELQAVRRMRWAAGQTGSVDCPADTIRVRAYPVRDGHPAPPGVDVPHPATGGRVTWTAPAGDWELWVYASVPKPGTLNPVHPLSGRRVIEKFFQRFQDHAPDRSSRGLNYFFHDELQFGVGDAVWGPDFAEQFLARKGYDVFDALPALFADLGAGTVKARLDYLDVRMQLVQERYFVPIFRWHTERGLIYGCDQGSRGLDPTEFGDYFGAVRWYTAPGHDTPGGHADLIKGKVSSSIAHLYRRPRVWLEGYHSLGWGAAPERLMHATHENYLYGCNLLNLHGLYYSTHGSFWEWAPPCYHFRMPYWEHMGVFLKYFERLSYLLSQGVHQSDIAILYPVTPGQAGLQGKAATDLAFLAGTRLFQSGRDFVFVDDDSVARARIEGGRLQVADTSYAALILPAMRGIRWPTLLKAQAFRQAGGRVIALGAVPEASDHAGADDPELNAVVRELFGADAAEVKSGARPAAQRHASGGEGILVSAERDPGAGLLEVLRPLPRDVTADSTVRALHRRVGPRDVYFVMDAAKGAEVTFRARGRAELWDAWTGETRPILAAVPVAEGTRLRMPVGVPEAAVIVFAPGEPEAVVTSTDVGDGISVVSQDGRWTMRGVADSPGPVRATILANHRSIVVRGDAEAGTTIDLDGDWEFELVPTLDNRWGDFRLPATPERIGPEARRFRYDERMPRLVAEGLAATGNAAGEEVTAGFGPQFWKLGPLPADADLTGLEARLAAVERLNPDESVTIGDRTYRWTRYAFSWRWGKEGDPGHQGWHGLKGNVTDDFLCLGKPVDGHNETVYREEPEGRRYFLWTSVVDASATRARWHLGGLLPAALYLGGKKVPENPGEVALAPGPQALLARYDGPGRGHLVLQDAARSPDVPARRTPLAMRWYDLPGVMTFDVRPAEARPVGWYRFTAPPGLRGFDLEASGTIEVSVDGRPARVTRRGADPAGARGVRFRVDLESARSRSSEVTIRVEPERGRYGGAAIPEPIRLDCGPGVMGPGDWSRGSVLETYSGGAWYRRDVVLRPEQLRGRVRLDLGKVVATAEVRVNGKTVGVRVAPPWVVDLGAGVRVGTNRLEVLVYNTLANHYLTVPTRYRGSPESGLLGPVRLECRPETLLTEER